MQAQLTDPDPADPPPAPTSTWSACSPSSPRTSHELPEPIQAELFTALDIQILWNAPMRQATFHATITDTTPQLINALLDRANDDDAAGPAHSPATSTNTSPSA